MWPFKKSPPKEDWRVTDEERWHTVETAGGYKKQHLEQKIVRFPDGATKWVSVGSSPFYFRQLVRIVKVSESAA